jgi:hypothetical protein
MTTIRNSRLAFFVAFALVLGGCGSGSRKAPPAPLAPPVNPATAASISGTVTFQGTAPVLRSIDMSAAPACVKANPSPVRPPVVVTGANGGLANVVVYVKSGLGHYRYPAPQSPVDLNQKRCMYVPRVIVLMVGQPFEVHNSDLWLHDIHPMLRNNRPWDKSQLPGSVYNASFENPEFAVVIGCMIHPWMRAYLFVFDQPYFAVTTDDGKFSLKNLPPGTYTIEAWHEGNQPLDQTVVVGPKESKSISFTFRPASAGGNTSAGL